MVGLEPGRVVGGHGERRGVRLAETERGERLEHRPDLVGDGPVEAVGQRPGPPPLLDLELTLRRAHRPADLIGLVQPAAGGDRDQLQHLLVEHHHPAGLAQHRFQPGVQVGRLVPLLPGPQERGDHVGLHRPGPEQRDVDDQVVEGLWTELADQFALPGRLDLEAAEGVRGADHPEGGFVVERDGVQLDPPGAGFEVADTVRMPTCAGSVGPVHPDHFVQRVGHRRLHPDTEHVELEQADVLDIVLVELAHREPEPAGFDRGAIEQPGVREHHPAGVQRDVPGQPVEPLYQVEEQVEMARGQPGGTQLGQLCQRVAHVPGPDVRERLRDRVDLTRRQTQRRAGVPDRVPDPVGVHHRDAGHPLGPEPVQDRLVDLGPSGGLYVDVDVGQLGPERGEEPFHQQVVPDRVDRGDAEQVVDQAARAGPAGCDPDPQPTDQGADLFHGQEVPGVAERADRAQLLLEPLLHRPQPAGRQAGVPATDPGFAVLAQHRIRGAAGLHPQDVRLGQVHVAEPDIRTGVEPAPLSQALGTGQQVAGVALVARRPGDLPGQTGHLLGGGQVALRGDPVQMPVGERDQPTGRVQDVGGDRAVDRGIPDRVAEHHLNPAAAGQFEHPGGVPEAGRGALRTLVADHLYRQAAQRHRGPPAGQHRPSDVQPTGQHGSAELRVRAEQNDQGRPASRFARFARFTRREFGAGPDCVPVRHAGVGGDQVESGYRGASFTRQVGGRDQPAELPPADACCSFVDLVLPQGEHRDPGVARVDARPAPHRGAPGPARDRDPDQRFNREVGPEQRGDTGGLAGRGELHRAVQTVPVGQGQGGHTVVESDLHQRSRGGRAEPQGVPGGDVEVGERRAHSQGGNASGSTCWYGRPR